MIRNSSTKKVVCALSGGVDSSVAASLLLQQEHSLSAIHMSNGNVHDEDNDDGTGTGTTQKTKSLQCSSESDWKDAQAVASHLGIASVKRLEFQAAYFTQVFEPYLANVQQGQMGNPDIACNRYVKFGALREYCKQHYCNDSFLATGHYARLWHSGQEPPPAVQEALATTNENENDFDWLLSNNTNRDGPILLAAADATKDQSYFLAGCSSSALSNVIFPLGDYFKKSTLDTTTTTVRQLAHDFDLPTANKRESMGICFVGKRPRGFRHFLQDYLAPATTSITFTDLDTGQQVATTSEPEHACLYTIGQGAKLGGSKTRYFVVSRDLQQNVVYVAAGTHHPALYTDRCTVGGSGGTVNWMVNGTAPPQPLVRTGRMRVTCRIRHLQPLVDATLELRDNNQFQVLFDKPVRGVTPGQYAVFYALDGLVCLGGGPIEQAGETYWEKGLAVPDNAHPAGHNDVSRITLVS
jgi:tRNA U34 2-thiouridine synthase MnmA/TrmU